MRRIATTTSLVVMILLAWAPELRARAPCDLPDDYPIALEARSTVLGTGRGVVASEQPSDVSPLQTGDVIRQVNGDRVETCDDVERAVAESFAKGLPLLLAVERPTGLVPIMVRTRAQMAGEPRTPAPDVRPTGVVERASVAVSRDVASVPAVAVSDHQVPASARALAVVPPVEPSGDEAVRRDDATAADASGFRRAHPIAETDLDASVGPDAIVRADYDSAEAEGETKAATPGRPAETEPRPRRSPWTRSVSPLPSAATVDAELWQAAVRVVELLRAVERHTTASVPMAVYEQERVKADAAVRAIDFGHGPGAEGVRRRAFSVLEIYYTASDILRVKVEYERNTRRQLRARVPSELPYFSDGDVPRWVAAYPFLEEAVLQPPKDRRFLQSAGRWSPDRALELLWSHARDETMQLASWTAGE